MNRAEYEREVYDHERQRGEYAEDVDTFVPNEHEVLATYVLQLIGPRRFAGPFPLNETIAPEHLREMEENLTDLLPEGYKVVIREWDAE